MKLKIIHTALAPNAGWSDLARSLHLLMPWQWPRLRRGPHLARLEEHMKKRVGAELTVAVGSGREALQMALAALPIPPGSIILVQSFTCMVVINAIRWAGHRPLFVDIDPSYNLDPADLENKIRAHCGTGIDSGVSPGCAAVIVQHTFGIPAQMRRIGEICRNNGLYIVEDCAHALGAVSESGNPGEVAQVGAAGDISIFSFGRSKVISAVNGGLVAVNNPALAGPVRLAAEMLQPAARGRTVQNLLHIPVTSLAKTFYWSPLGKLVMLVSQKLHLINLEVTPAEKQSRRPHYFISRLPNAMARLALAQLAKLDRFNLSRRKAAQYYFDHLSVAAGPDPSAHPGAIFLRYPLQVANPRQVLRQAKKQGVILGDWYSVPVAPCDVDASKTGYVPGSCPHCESANARMINLPTHPALTTADLRRIVKIINQYAEN